jgi:hypothetical protein
LMVQAMVTGLQSRRTLAWPRSGTWRNPGMDLRLPDTGSGLCLRRAQSALPPGVFRRCAMDPRGVGPAGSGGAGAKRPARGGWCACRPMAIRGSVPAAAQAPTLAALKQPLPAKSVAMAPGGSGKAAGRPGIGCRCCLSFGARTTSAATTRRRPAATTACAMQH